MMNQKNYRANAVNDAADTVRNYANEILRQLLVKGKASDDLFNDYANGDSWHHEQHVDRDYDLQEAAALLNELSDCEETDSGLWEGEEPRQVIAIQAAYTYGNAVYLEWRDLIEEINCCAKDIFDDFDEKRIELVNVISDLKVKLADPDAIGTRTLQAVVKARQTELEGLDEKRKEALSDTIEKVAG